MTTETNNTPPGWKLVPVDPTEAMIERCGGAPAGLPLWPQILREVWRVMLATSPEPPARHLPSREEIANMAVLKNLSESGEPMFNSAQGYACALSAVDLILSLLRVDTAKGPTHD